MWDIHFTADGVGGKRWSICCRNQVQIILTAMITDSSNAMGVCATPPRPRRLQAELSVLRLLVCTTCTINNRNFRHYRTCIEAVHI